MARKFTAPDRQPTRDVTVAAGGTPSALSRGAIIGIAVGGAAGLIGVALLAWYCLRKRKLSRENYRYDKPGSMAPSHSHTHSGSGGVMGYPAWSSPVSSHNTAMSPVYGPGQSPGWNPQTQQQAYPEQSHHPRHHGMGPVAMIPNHPIEMPGNAHDTGASEAYEQAPPLTPKSPNGHRTSLATVGAGDSPTKRGAAGGRRETGGSSGEWQLNSATGTLQRVRTGGDGDGGDYGPGLSPVAPRAHHYQGLYQQHHRNNSNSTSPVYADGGYGPRELSGDAPPPPSPLRPMSDHGEVDGDRRHNTYYHR